MLGGEQSGHILCRHYSITGDGLLTALHSGFGTADWYAFVGWWIKASNLPQLLRNVRVEDRDRRLGWQHCEAVQRAIAQAEAAMGKDEF